jgi:hypothetical protein
MSGFFQKLFSDNNLSSQPEETTAGESPRRFTVGELANLLPPDFLSTNGVDLEREVDLDLGTARRTLAEGLPVVMLSEVYRACPEIFPRPVGADQDFEVRLPTSRVRALLGGQEAAPLPAGAEAAASPFTMVAGAGVPDAHAAPFQPVPPVQSPFQVASMVPKPEEAPAAGVAAPESPFVIAGPPPAAVASPFAMASPEADKVPQPIPPAPRPVPVPKAAMAATSPFRPVGALVPPAPASAAEDVHFDLADTLRAVPESVLGFTPALLPSGIECRVAKSSLKPGFFPGTAMIALRDVVNSLPAAYRGVFAATKIEHEVAVPVSLDAAAETPAPLAEVPAGPAIAPANAAMPPAPAAPPAAAPVVSPFVPVPQEADSEPLLEAVPAPAGQVSFMPATSEESSPLFESPFATLAREDAGLGPVSATAPLKPIVEAAPAPAPAPPQPLAAVVAAPAPDAVVPPPAPMPRPAAGASDGDEADEWRQLELRAIFGLSGILDGAGVFELAAGLEGVRACAFFHGEKVVFRHAPDGTSLESMPGVFRHLAAMAHELGVADARNFTLQTDRGLVAFFSEGEACLAVQHEGRRFAPGTRERLVLILRELAREG